MNNTLKIIIGVLLLALSMGMMILEHKNKSFAYDDYVGPCKDSQNLEIPNTICSGKVPNAYLALFTMVDIITGAIGLILLLQVLFDKKKTITVN
jgi:hypothetical protein